MKKELNCVLLVDDNESDNFLHKLVIEKSGITNFIGIAVNGREAIDFLTTKLAVGQKESSFPQPELIFLDINMPVMDGWEFLEEYHKLEAIHKGKVVILMLTTSLSSADVDRTQKLEELVYLNNKPLTMEMIDGIMRRHFPEYLCI